MAKGQMRSWHRCVPQRPSAQSFDDFVNYRARASFWYAACPLSGQSGLSSNSLRCPLMIQSGHERSSLL